jgi:predicted NAD-dependent protein-ADP-ribosyltransferase YbiA (DUF1768 family)
MAQSKLDPNIYYPELRKLDEEDKDLDASLFQIEIDDQDVIIALGEAKYTFIDDNIVYFPVYNIKNDFVEGQIGIYEIMADKAPYIYDEDGDIDVTELGPILLYSFVTPSYLEEQNEDSKLIEQEDEEEDEEDKGDQDKESELVEVDIDDIIEEPDKEEDEESEQDKEDEDLENKTEKPVENEILTKKEEKEQAEKERKAYKKSKGEDWVQTFMRNNNYTIIENEGGGDCLFASIRDGLKRVGINKSVDEMRMILAKEADNELFEGYNEMYTFQINEIAMLNSDLKNYKDEVKDLQKKIQKESDRDELEKLNKRVLELKKMYDQAKKELANATNLLEEYAFMEGVTNLDQFKEMLKSCDFWGETWAISTLERVLNIKLILFSEEAYEDGDLNNVILCGQLNDTILEDKGEFDPDYYIMLEYIGNHYRLITYKNRGAFKFKGIPYDLKVKIVNKCLEKAAGPFYLINDFKEMLGNLDIETDNDKKVEIEQIGLYDPSTVFQFYSKSSNAPLPGKGAGESINDKNKTKYSELATVPEWRRKLSNFWVEPFKLDGHIWASVEHYYQASKFKEGNPDFYLSFSLDGNPDGELAKNPKMAKGAGGKTGKYEGKIVRDKKIQIDEGFFNGKHLENMKKAQMAKFSQNVALKEMLLATKDAKLQHYIRASPPVIFTELMEVRKELEKNN